MIKLTVDPKVLSTLSLAFPKPANAALRALDKYIRTLELLIFESMEKGQTELNRKFGLFTLSLHKLANKGPQIGKRKIRLHAWLLTNQIPLIIAVERGSNLTKTLSTVKLSKLVHLEDTLEADAAKTVQIDQQLNNQQDSGKELIFTLFPDLQDSPSNEVLAQYDLCEIDCDSLKNYIEWLETDAFRMTEMQKKNSLRQARTILVVARHLEGLFPQKRKSSSFGRTYYHGTSVQTVNKTLRHAMLGNCWEYDIRSSVVSWKMGFAKQCYTESGSALSFRKCFQSTLCFLEGKKDFMATLRYEVFNKTTNVAVDLQDKLLKQAMTALSFGARLITRGWKLKDGTWSRPSLVEIFKNKDECTRFMNNQSVMQFKAEQELVEDYIHRLYKKHDPSLLKLSWVKTTSGRLNKPKLFAYLYQHAETAVMDIVRNGVIACDRVILANIHDAIVVRHRIGADNKSLIELKMREATGNPYWELGATEFKRYEARASKATLKELAEHKARIAEETAYAASFYKNSHK